MPLVARGGQARLEINELRVLFKLARAKGAIFSEGCDVRQSHCSSRGKSAAAGCKCRRQHLCHYSSGAANLKRYRDLRATVNFVAIRARCRLGNMIRVSKTRH
jgi:hypothetical protein